MSESVGIVCPVCRSKLRLKGSVLSKATVACPKCGTTLDVPKSELPSAPAPKASASSTLPASEPTRPVAKAAQDAAKPPLGPLRKRKKAAEDIPSPYGEDASGADDGGDLFSGSNDEFSGFGAEPDPYGNPGALPPRKRQRSGVTSANSGAEPESALEAGGTRRGGFFSWVGYGSLAAIAGIVLQTLLGFTNFLWPLLIATICTGSMVGYAVRHAAGTNKGWGPGIVAVLIAAFAIFAGRVGAFSVSSDVDKILGIPMMAPLTPEEAEARVVKESTEPFLITDIAEEVEYDEDFLTAQNIDSDEVSDFWLEHSDEEDPAKRYFPAVWTEATRRWNANTPEQKESIRKSKEMELRENYGIMSDDAVQQRITEATTNDAMISETADTLLADEEWMAKSGITEEQLDAHWENADFDEDASGESQYLPAVWTEAKRRWEELPPEQKQARIKETSDDLRADLVFSPDEAKDVENIGKAVRVVIIIFGALFTLFWGIGSLICSISALVGAFKIGFGMQVAR